MTTPSIVTFLTFVELTKSKEPLDTILNTTASSMACLEGPYCL